MAISVRLCLQVTFTYFGPSIDSRDIHLFANHESINSKLLHPPDISTFKDCFFFPSHLRGKDCVQMPHPIFFKFPAELGSDIEIWVKFWFTQMYSHYVILSTVQSIMGNLFHREIWKQTKNEKKIKPLLLNFSSNSYWRKKNFYQ